MRVFLSLAAFAVFAVPVRAKTEPVCAAPAVPPEFRLPAYTVTEKTPACDRRIDFAYARTGKKAEAFLQAQRRIHQDVNAILELQNGASCEATARSYATLRNVQYAAIAKTLAAELQSEIGSCAVVAPVKLPPVPAPDDAPAPEPTLPPMVEPI